MQQNHFIPLIDLSLSFTTNVQIPDKVLSEKQQHLINRLNDLKKQWEGQIIAWNEYCPSLTNKLIDLRDHQILLIKLSPENIQVEAQKTLYEKKLQKHAKLSAEFLNYLKKKLDCACVSIMYIEQASIEVVENEWDELNRFLIQETLDAASAVLSILIKKKKLLTTQSL